MEHAKWKNRILSASEIARDYSFEKTIREASNRGELCCPDPECQQPILKYCHGDVIEAYFAHKNHGACDYAAFDSETTSVIRDVQKKLFAHFQEVGYEVEQEVRLLPHHYAHLALDMETGNKLAIEIGTNHTTLEQVQKLKSLYEKAQIPVTWIVIGDPELPIEEANTCFMKRYQLNESESGDLFIINIDGDEVAQCRYDRNQYCYGNKKISSPNYPDVYKRTAPLAGLIVKNGKLEINGFDLVFQKWLLRKKKAFDFRIETMRKEEQEEKDRRQFAEQQREDYWAAFWKQRKSQKKKTPMVTNTQGKSYDQRRKEVLPRMNQSDEKVWDSMDHRWIRCKLCGKIDESSEFSQYGGIHEETLGICRECYIKNARNNGKEGKKSNE